MGKLKEAWIFQRKNSLPSDKLTLLRLNDVVGIFCHRIGICPWQTSVRQSWLAVRILGISITFLSKLYFISTLDVVQSQHEVRAFICNRRLSLTPLMKIRPMMRIKNWKVSLSDWRSIRNGFRMSMVLLRSFTEALWEAQNAPLVTKFCLLMSLLNAEEVQRQKYWFHNQFPKHCESWWTSEFALSFRKFLLEHLKIEQWTNDTCSLNCSRQRQIFT